eukprot:3779772-Rhodomonas_salina.3
MLLPVLCDGTELAYAAIRALPRNQIHETAFLVQIVVKLRFLALDFGVYAISGTELAYAARESVQEERAAGEAGGQQGERCYPPTRLPGTDLAYAAIPLRACYAMSGTDLACAAILLRACPVLI